MIRIEQGEKRYGGVVALRGVDMEVKSGEIVGIIGRSGAGKSTVLRSMNGLEVLDGGKVLYRGEDLVDLSRRGLMAVRREIGMIFQHFNLLARRTVLENVSLPMELRGTVDLSRAVACLEEVGMAEKAGAYPSELSGGQKQRVAIARALAGEAKVLLCDEATSALDPETTAEVLHLIRELNKRHGLTVVLITHEIQVIRDICTRVYVMEGGEVVESGPVEGIFANPEHQITKGLVQSVINSRVPEVIRENLKDSGGDEVVLRLSFFGGTEYRPIISGLVRELGVEINIKAGYIDQIGESTYGTLVVTLAEEVEAAKAFLEKEGVQVERLGYI